MAQSLHTILFVV